MQGEKMAKEKIHVVEDDEDIQELIEFNPASNFKPYTANFKHQTHILPLFL
jgi:hypothetical protein